MQRLGLQTHGFLRGAASLPDAGDGQAQHDGVDHADHHRHVLDDVRRLRRVVVVRDPAIAEKGDGQDDGAGGHHRESENKPFRHGCLRRSAGGSAGGTRAQYGHGEDSGRRHQKHQGDDRRSAVRFLPHRGLVRREGDGLRRGRAYPHRRLRWLRPWCRRRRWCRGHHAVMDGRRVVHGRRGMVDGPRRGRRRRRRRRRLGSRLRGPRWRGLRLVGVLSPATAAPRDGDRCPRNAVARLGDVGVRAVGRRCGRGYQREPDEAGHRKQPAGERNECPRRSVHAEEHEPPSTTTLRHCPRFAGRGISASLCLSRPSHLSPAGIAVRGGAYDRVRHARSERAAAGRKHLPAACDQ